MDQCDFNGRLLTFARLDCNYDFNATTCYDIKAVLNGVVLLKLDEPTSACNFS